VLKLVASINYYFQRGFYYLRKGLDDPSLAFNYLFHGSIKAMELQVKHIAKKLGVKAEEVNQLYQSPVLADLRRNIIKANEGTPFVGVGTAGYDIYVLLRMFQPETVVETGVEAGVSSSFLLQALEDNKKGKLYSIDYRVQEGDRVESIKDGLIPVEAIPKDKETGFVIPDNLRGRWTFRPGKSSDILPGLLKELGKVNVFWHDSDHSYENMMFEFTTAWAYLTEGGLLLAHDTGDNNSFRDFAKKVNRRAIELTFRGGLTALIK
jgi:hypothetical protein